MIYGDHRRSAPPAVPALAEVAQDDFLAFRCRILHWRSGHGIDEGEVWTRDGRPIARIRQLRAIF